MTAWRRTAWAGLVLALAAPPALADGPARIEVELKDHVFTPSTIEVPAGQRVEILVRNRDGTAEEFDSTALKVEKVIAGGDEGVVRLHPLDPGEYPFIGEYHSDTAKGVVVAKWGPPCSHR